MNKIYPKIIIGLLVCIFGLEVYFNKTFIQSNKEVAKNKNEFVALKQQAAQEQETSKQKEALLSFTYKVMELSPKSKLSQAKKEILAQKIVNIVQDNINGVDAQEQYISMLKIESAFDNSRSSPVGAIGLAQIMPATFKKAIEDCNIDATIDDIHNEDINITVGACYFSLLLDENDNNPRLSSLAYNGGARVVEKFKKLGDVNQESSNYALKVEHIKDLANK